MEAYADDMLVKKISKFSPWRFKKMFFLELGKVQSPNIPQKMYLCSKNQQVPWIYDDKLSYIAKYGEVEGNHRYASASVSEWYSEFDQETGRL